VLPLVGKVALHLVHDLLREVLLRHLALLGHLRLVLLEEPGGGEGIMDRKCGRR
jgi:hypothetical protein